MEVLPLAVLCRKQVFAVPYLCNQPSLVKYRVPRYLDHMLAHTFA